jgi:hypothetical protein
MIDEIVKGDAVDFVCNIGEDITGWFLRAEIWDEDDNIIEKANALAGGDATQIEATDLINGIFIVHVNTSETASFGDVASIEVEAEVLGKKYTVLRDAISFQLKRINWTVPSPYPPS